MARQHVFPVCSASSETIVPLNKIEGGRSAIEGSIIFSETEDPNFFLGENLDGTELRQSIYFLDDTKSEVLFDFSSPIDTDLVGEEEGIVVVFPWQEQGAYKYILLWEEVSGGNRKVFTAEPGSIFCIALKSSVDEMWRDWLLFQGFISYGLGDDRNRSIFVDGAPYTAPGDKLNDAIYYGGQWITVMWTGTRFVLLGSNNWY